MEFEIVKKAGTKKTTTDDNGFSFEILKKSSAHDKRRQEAAKRQALSSMMPQFKAGQNTIAGSIADAGARIKGFDSANEEKKYAAENPNLYSAMGGAKYNPIPSKTPTVLTDDGKQIIANAQKADNAVPINSSHNQRLLNEEKRNLSDQLTKARAELRKAEETAAAYGVKSLKGDLKEISEKAPGKVTLKSTAQDMLNDAKRIGEIVSEGIESVPNALFSPFDSIKRAKEDYESKQKAVNEIEGRIKEIEYTQKFGDRITREKRLAELESQKKDLYWNDVKNRFGAIVGQGNIKSNEYKNVKKEINELRDSLYGDSRGYDNAKAQLKMAGTKFQTSLGATSELFIGTPIKAAIELFGGDSSFLNTKAYRDALNEAAQKEANAAAAAVGDKYNIGGQIITNVVQQIPNFILAGMTSVGSAAVNLGSSAGKIAGYLQSLAKNPMFWTSFVLTAGNDYEEAVEDGAHPAVATAYALVTSSLNAAIEVGGGIETLPAELDDVVTSRRGIYNWLVSSFEEGGEELLQGGVSKVMSRLFYDRSPITDESVSEFAKESLNSGAMGVLMGAFLGGGQLTFQNIVNAGTAQQYKTIGESVIKSNLLNTVIEYANASDNAEMRALANQLSNNTIDSESVGRLYSYMCRDIDTAINSQKTVEAATEGLKSIVSNVGAESGITSGIAVPQFIDKVAELGGDTSAAINGIADIVYSAPQIPILQSSANDSNVETADVEPMTDIKTPTPESGYFDDGSGDEFFPDDDFEFTEPAARDITREPTKDELFEVAISGKAKTAAQTHISDIAKKIDPDLKIEFVKDLSTNGKFLRKSNRLLIHADLPTAQMYVEIFKHEFMHRLETRKLYNSFMRYCFNKSEAFEKYVRAAYTAATGKVHNGGAESVINELVGIYYENYKNNKNTPPAEREAFTWDDAQKELIADFFGDILFQGKAYRESIASALESGAITPSGDIESSIYALTELAQKERTLFEKIIDAIKELISTLKSEWRNRTVVQDLEYLEKRLEWVYQSADNKKALRKAQDDVKNDIGVLDNGNTYVIASRKVIKGTSLKEQRSDITKFFRKLLKNKPSVDIPTIEGDILTITMEETADKARDNYKSVKGVPVKMTDDEFRVKLNVEAHIDEIAETSISDKRPRTNDEKNHEFAVDGFTYRTAYFEDFDGQYYRVRFSVGYNGTIATVYNVGKIEGSVPSSAKLIAVVGSQALDDSLPNNSILENESAVNSNSTPSEANYTETGENGQNSLGSPMQQLRYNPERYAKWLTRRFAAKAEVADIAPKLRQIVIEDNKRNKELSENTSGEIGNTLVSERLINELAEEIAQTVKPQLTADAQERLADLRHTAVKLDDFQKAEIESEFGNITNFRRQTGIKISDDGVPLDSRWQELAATYPELFSADTNAADMPTRIAEIVENLSENTEPVDYEGIAADIATQIQNTLDTTGPRAEQRKLNEARKEGRLQEQERARRKVRHLVGTSQSIEGELAAEYKAVADRAVAEDRQRRAESQDRESNRKAIQRNLQHLDHLLRANENVRHIPESLKPVINQVCKLFLDNSATVFQAKELADIRLYYNNYLQSEEINDTMQSQDVKSMLELLEAELSGKSLNDLDNEGVEIIRVITDYFNKLVNQENEAFVNGKKYEVAELGRKAADTIESKKTLRVLKALNTQGAESVREFFYEGNLTPYFLFKRLGGVFQKVFNDLIVGQSRAVKNMDIAHSEIESIKKRRKYTAWKNQTFTYTTERGIKLQLTVEQLLQIYATALREQNNKVQGAKHLLGGIVLDQKAINDARKSQGKNGECMQNLRSKAIKLTDRDIIALSSKLSAEQKGYADDVVSLMSNWCAALGNEVTMQLYNYRKYTEKYYIPYVSASEFLEYNVLKGEQRLMKSPSFSKSLQKKANNPLLIQGFSQVAANHIDTMCGYNGTAVAIDTLNKMLNHNNLSELDNTDESLQSAESVWATIERTYGSGMVHVLKNFIADVNQGVTTDKKYSVFNNMVRTFRKTAVMANLSVAVQQPTAIIKATLVMKPKYLLEAKVKNKKALWAECCLYAPIASLKEHGQFHGEGGTHNTEWILGNDLDTSKEKIKDLFSKDSKTRDDYLGKLAEKGDQVAWRHLWAAVKLEIADTTNLKEDSEEFLKACGERFTDIVVQTQVYDSVLSRSQNMRDKGLIGSMTSFMMEPTIAINLAADALVSHLENPTRASGKKLARTFFVLSTTELAAALFKSLITAMRNDDEDETIIEKYVEAVITNFISGMNFASKVPLISDVFSLIEGYTVERPDMQVLADFVAALEGLTSERKTIQEKIVNLVGALGNLFGVPVKNVYRDIAAICTTFASLSDFELPKAEELKESAITGLSEGALIISGVVDFVKYIFNSIEKQGYLESVIDNKTYKALSDDDKKKVSTNISTYIKNEKTFKTTPAKSKQFESLYETLRKSGANSKAYRNARKEMIASGIDEDDLTIGLEIAKIKYLAANGITMAEYYTAKATMNKKDSNDNKIYDTDNSGGLSVKEKRRAIDDLSDFSSKEKSILKNILS